MFVSIRKIAILITINFLLVCSLSSQERKTTAIKKTPNVLIVHLVKGFGGGCQQTISVLKSLYKKRWNIRALVAEGSRLQETLKKLKLPYVSCKMRSFMQGKTLDQYLYKILLRICQKYKIDIIHCRKEHEYVAVKHVAKYLGIKAIAHYHSHEIPAAEKFKGFDAFLSSCPSVTEFIAKEANKKIHGIKHVGFMVPPHDEDKFLNFIPTQTKEDFFKQQDLRTS